MSEVQRGSADYRQQQLKEIVKNLHEGSDIRAVRKRFARLIRNVSPEEIARMEQALIAEGIPVEQVQKVCDVHVQVFEQALERGKKSKVLPGHPLHTYQQENRALRKILKRMRPLLKQAPRGARRQEFQGVLKQIGDIEIHYRRKENQLFPYLEQVGFTGPAKVMWGKHEEIRTRLREFEEAYRQQDWDRFAPSGRALLRALRRMMFMDEKILFPTSLKKLSERWRVITPLIAGFGIICWIFVVVSQINSSYFCRFGVASSEQTPLVLYNSKSFSQDTKLMELPSGAVVGWCGTEICGRSRFHEYLFRHRQPVDHPRTQRQYIAGHHPQQRTAIGRSMGAQTRGTQDQHR